MNASAAAPIVNVGLSPLDEGTLNTGAGTISSSNLGKTAKITSSGKGAAASVTIIVPGTNNDLQISAKTFGTAFNGVTVNFTNGAAGTGPGSETVAYDEVSKTLTFEIAPEPTDKFVVWRYSLGNNLTSLTRTEYNDSGENITNSGTGKQLAGTGGHCFKDRIARCRQNVCGLFSNAHRHQCGGSRGCW